MINNNYLMHHGILGQKWGVRRGDNYPLEDSEHSAAEKKAGWKKSLDNFSNNSNTKSDKKEINDQLDEYDKKYADYRKRSDKYMKEFAKAEKKFVKGKDYKAALKAGKVTERTYSKLMSNDPRIKKLSDQGRALNKEIDTLRKEYSKIISDNKTKYGKNFVDAILNERR